MSRGQYGLVRYRDTRGRLAKISGEWFHSGADRKLALDQITAGFQALTGEILHGQHGNRDAARMRALGQWLEVDVAPTIAAWNTFAAREQSSWWVRAATSWETFLGWRERLRNLRQLARAHGIALQSPEPPPLPMTIWEKSDLGTGSEVAPWFGLAKLAIGGAIAVTGAITVYSVAREYTAYRRASK